jgi:hypothetical protein
MAPPLVAHTFSANSNTAAAASLATKVAMEETVRRYFMGVHERTLPRSVAVSARRRFGACSTNTDISTKGSDLTDRCCMEFVLAHPDVKIDFHYGPECGRDSDVRPVRD